MEEIKLQDVLPNTVKLLSQAPMIYKKMADVLRDIGAVGKDQQNRAQGYKFRGIDDVYNVVNQAVKKHGIFCIPEIRKIIVRERIETAKGGGGWHQILEISYKFFAEDGSFVEAIVWGEAAEFGGDKVTNKCMSIAHKYALFQIFMIPTVENDDPDRDSPYQQQQNEAPAQQRPPVKTTIKSHPAAPAAPKTPERDIEDLRGEMFAILETAPPAFFAKMKMDNKYMFDKIAHETNLETIKNMYGHMERALS
jgi:hypothetical protein